MSALDFLVELGTEELPPKALNTLAEAFLAGIDKGLQAAGLNYETKTVYAAPRRLAVLITSLATLGEKDHAKAAYEKALEAFKSDDAALGQIEAAASNAGVTP